MSVYSRAAVKNLIINVCHLPWKEQCLSAWVPKVRSRLPSSQFFGVDFFGFFSRFFSFAIFNLKVAGLYFSGIQRVV